MVSSELRILVLSPSKNHFPINQIFEPNMNQPNVEKRKSYPEIFSGFLKESGKCMSLIQLPEHFEDYDMMNSIFLAQRKVF